LFNPFNSFGTSKNPEKKKKHFSNLMKMMGHPKNASSKTMN
jgi:hypothetical protein